MSTTTSTIRTETQTFRVVYPVVTYWEVEVERDASMTPQELVASVQRDELVSGEAQEDGAWDEVKDAWFKQKATAVFNEEGEDIL